MDSSKGLYDINEEYLKEHYREMMYVDDVPLPLFILEHIVPDMKNIMIERIINEGRTSLYGRYRDGHFTKSGENYIDESARLFKLYLEKHPEFAGVVNYDISELKNH